MLAGNAQAPLIAGKDRIWQVGNFMTWHVAPQPLQIVIAAALFTEHVNDESAKVQQCPVCGAVPFAMFGLAPQLLVELLFHFAANRLYLRRAKASAQHKIFREGAQAAKVKHGDAGGFFVLHRLNGEAHGSRELFQIHLYRPCLRMYSSTRAETSP